MAILLIVCLLSVPGQDCNWIFIRIYGNSEIFELLKFVKLILKFSIKFSMKNIKNRLKFKKIKVKYSR